MTRDSILESLKAILEEVLELEDLVISERTTAGDIPEWDSIMHVEVIVAIEDKFDVKFMTSEIIKFKKIGDIVDAILDKI